ncbi:MAG: hypothetical protein LCH61_16675 [Proteobacteria bacterium]|nr:hypothetical protein [Pseudomonadota bacterium]
MHKFAAVALFTIGLSLPASGQAPSRPGVAVPEGARIANYDDDRLRVSCRRKVRRHLGPAKGRHTGMLRIAYVEQCVANGGRLT